MKQKLESNRGITIISLVVTIIVLIILASVTINVMIGKNSVLDVTKTEKYNTQRSMLVETLRMELLDRQKEELEPLKDNEISEVLEKHGKVVYTDKEEIDGVIVNEEFDIKLSEIWENSYREEHIKLEVEGYTGIYDGKAHNAIISVTTNPAGATVEYAIENGKYSSTIPQVTDANTYSISIRATKEGYIKAEKTVTVTVRPQTNTRGNLVLSETSGTITYPNNGAFTVTKNTSGGALSVTSSDTNIATASISGTTVTITPKAITTDGKKTTITVTSAATSNYEAQTATYVATVNMGKITINATAYSGKYDGKAHNALTTVSTNPTGTTIEYSLNGGTYSTTMPQVTGASTYSISIRATKAGYAKAETTKTITVGKQSNTNGNLVLTPASGTITYPNNGKFTVSKNVSGGALSVKSSDESIATASISGTTVTSAATSNYEAQTATYEVTINRGTIDLDATPYSGNYDGKAHNALTAISTNPTGTTIEYSLNGGAYSTTMPQVTGASTYSISIRATKAGYAKAETTITVTVGKQTNTNGNLTLSATSGIITYPNNGTFTVTKNTSGGALSVKSSDESIATASISGTTVTITPKAITTDGKKTTIIVTSAATSNYEAQTAKYEVTINRGTIDLDATIYTGVYDGQSHDAVSNIKVVPNDAKVEYSIDGGKTYTTAIPKVTNAGEFAVTIKANKAGYKEKVITKEKGKIDREKSATVSTKNGTYDGTMQTGITGENVDFSGTISAINAGEYKANVTPKSDYAWSDGSTNTKEVTFTINKRAITVTAEAKTKTYGEANPALTYKTTGAVSGQTAKFNGNLACSATATSGVGTYDITQGTLALADNGTFLAGNYQIAYTGAKLTVNAKNASTFTATLATTSYTYDGTAKTPAVTVKDGSTALTNGTHYTVTYSNNVNAGTGKVIITGKGNYTGTKELTFTINKRAITVTAGSSSKTYNGTALTNSSATLTAGSLASGQTLTASATGTITNAGSVANTVSTAVVKNSAGTDVSSNYTITKVNGTLTVNKATGTLSLSATSGTITYPSNGSFTITSNTSGGTLSVTSSDTSVATASISGTTVTITPKAISTDGKKTTITITSAETTNYVAQSKTYVATVNRGTITISATAYKGIYDGEAHSVLTAVSTEPTGTTLRYNLDGKGWQTSIPTIIEVGSYTIAIEASKAGYVTINKTIPVEIEKQLVTGISLNSNDVTVTKGDTTQKLIATITPKTAYNKTIVWKSSDTNIMEVDQNGTITAKNYGIATISAEAQDGSGVKATGKVRVAGTPTGTGVVVYNWNESTGKANDLHGAISGTWASTTILTDGDEASTAHSYQDYRGGIYVKFPTREKISKIIIKHTTDKSYWQVRLFDSTGVKTQEKTIDPHLNSYEIDVPDSQKECQEFYIELESVNNVWWCAVREIYIVPAD